MTRLCTCYGECQQYKAHMPPNNESRYASGQKRCTMCGIFLIYAGLWCPCCGLRLRIHRRSSKDKLRNRMDKDKKEALAMVIRY